MSDPRLLARHEIEVLRRSLVIGNGLPTDQIRRLLETCDALFRREDTLDARDSRLRAEVEALRPVVAELRTRLRAIKQTLQGETSQPRAANIGPVATRSRTSGDGIERSKSSMPQMRRPPDRLRPGPRVHHQVANERHDGGPLGGEHGICVR